MGTPCQIDVKLAKVEGRKNATVKDRNGSTYKAPVFMVSHLPMFGLPPFFAYAMAFSFFTHESISCDRMEKMFADKS